MHPHNEMQALWCTLILAWRHLRFAFPERDANPMLHTHSWLATPRFCIPRTRCEPYGSTIILGRRNLGFAFPERDASHVVHTHPVLAKLKFCIPRTRGEPSCALFVVGSRQLLFAVSERQANLTVRIHTGLAKPTFGTPRSGGESYGAHSFGSAKPKFCIQNERRTLWCAVILGWGSVGFAVRGRDAKPMAHTHFGLAKTERCIQKKRCESYGTRSFWAGALRPHPSSHLPCALSCICASFPPLLATCLAILLSLALHPSAPCCFSDGAGRERAGEGRLERGQRRWGNGGGRKVREDVCVRMETGHGGA